MSESNIGPQKGPSSVWKIQAETQYVYRILDEYHGCVEAIENDTVFATLTHKIDGQQYYVEKPLNEFPDVINQIKCFDCKTIEDASGKKSVVIELNIAKPYHAKPYHCTKCGGAGWAQRSTGEVVECDECDSCGL